MVSMLRLQRYHFFCIYKSFFTPTELTFFRSIVICPIVNCPIVKLQNLHYLCTHITVAVNIYTEIKDIDASSWRSLLTRSAVATWFQTLEAYRFYASLPQEMTPFVFAIEEGSQDSPISAESAENTDTDTSLRTHKDRHATLTGVIVGYITRERSALKQYFSRRAIIIGGPLLDENISEEALVALLHAVRSNLQQRAIYIETRNFHDYSPWRSIFEQCGFTYQPHLNYQIDCTADALQRMKSNRRRQVRKAFANGATIREADNEQQVQAFYHLLHQLYRTRIKTPLPSQTFFLTLYHQQAAKFLLVYHQDTIIGGIVCPILGQDTIYEWFVCGLNKEYRQQYPSVLATYAAIQYATTHGIATFDMMGAGTPDIPYGVRTFKARFGGQEVEHGRYCAINHPRLYRLGVAVIRLLHHFY